MLAEGDGTDTRLWKAERPDNDLVYGGGGSNTMLRTWDLSMEDTYLQSTTQVDDAKTFVHADISPDARPVPRCGGGRTLARCPGRAAAVQARTGADPAVHRGKWRWLRGYAGFSWCRCLHGFRRHGPG